MQVSQAAPLLSGWGLARPTASQSPGEDCWRSLGGDPEDSERHQRSTLRHWGEKAARAKIPQEMQTVLNRSD